jgi:hypothetical protein
MILTDSFVDELKVLDKLDDDGNNHILNYN